jgi:hypothetical protein
MVSGLMEGYGRMIYGPQAPNAGDVYEGAWLQGLYHSSGLYLW